MVAKTMDQLVSLCKRRGFIFQNADIYGGLRACMTTVRWALS